MTNHLPLSPQPGRSSGFTLIEVMIVVAIVAILAAVALPSYQSYVRRGQLQEGLSQMSGFQLQMEQFYQDNRSYASSGGCPATLTGKLTSKYFTFTCTASTTGYTLTASGKTGTTTGYDYTINQAGERKTTAFAGATQSLNCWADRAPSCN